MSSGAHVLFGFSAPGLFMIFAPPVSGVYPGVEISATMLDNLLADDFIHSVPTVYVVVITLIMVLLAGVATSRVSGFFPSVLVYILFIGAPVVLCLIAYRWGFWMPLVDCRKRVARYAFHGRADLLHHRRAAEDVHQECLQAVFES